MALTQKQENFCLAIVDGDNQADAYRKAYNAENMKPDTVYKRASELMDNGEVAGRIAELRAPATEKVLLTLEEHLTTLDRLRMKAEASEKFGPAIQAEVARGKAAGLQVEKQQVSGNIVITLKNKFSHD